MTYLNGGYSIIKKGDANIYASLEKALTNGKPILFYEDDNTCYYIDSISKSGDDIVLTKGGKTITITSSNVVSEVGEIQTKVYTYEINDNDVYGVFYSDVNLDDIDISSVATELTDADKVALTKLYKFVDNLKYKNFIIPSISRTDSWLNSFISISKSESSLSIVLNVIDASDLTNVINGSYNFSVSDGVVTAITNITDTTFDDGFKLYKKN